jgi:hypothetical protein
MANNQYVNKVAFGGNTIIDLTADTITPDKLAYGATAHDKSGAPITGTSTKDADTSDATASASEILSTKTAYVNGVKLTGEMPNRGSVTGTITTKAGAYTIQNGYHDGTGSVAIDSTEQAKMIPENIREGVTILGVLGTMSGSEDVHAQSKTATPYTTAQTVLPDTGYNYLTQVTVEAIAYVETDNAAGGKTVTIGTVAPS